MTTSNAEIRYKVKRYQDMYGVWDYHDNILVGARLYKKFGDAVNRMRCLQAEEVEIGAGATLNVGSNRYPFTVVLVSRSYNRIDITVQADDTEKADGYDYYNNQVYKYRQNKDGRIITYRFEPAKPDMGWRETVRNSKGTFVLAKHPYGYLSVGTRNAYMDPSF